MGTRDKGLEEKGWEVQGKDAIDVGERIKKAVPVFPPHFDFLFGRDGFEPISSP
jgi:hypothetical protein